MLMVILGVHVGMLIEIMAGKAAAVQACCYDATPFTYTEDDDPITYFGHCLRKGLQPSCVNELGQYCHCGLAQGFSISGPTANWNSIPPYI